MSEKFQKREHRYHIAMLYIFYAVAMMGLVLHAANDEVSAFTTVPAQATITARLEVESHESMDEYFERMRRKHNIQGLGMPELITLQDQLLTARQDLGSQDPISEAITLGEMHAWISEINQAILDLGFASELVKIEEYKALEPLQMALGIRGMYACETRVMWLFHPSFGGDFDPVELVDQYIAIQLLATMAHENIHAQVQGCISPNLQNGLLQQAQRTEQEASAQILSLEVLAYIYQTTDDENLQKTALGAVWYVLGQMISYSIENTSPLHQNSPSVPRESWSNRFVNSASYGMVPLADLIDDGAFLFQTIPNEVLIDGPIVLSHTSALLEEMGIELR